MKDYIFIKEELSKGKTKNEVYKYIKDNDYIKVGQGIYSLDKFIVDELYLLHKRCPKGVISHMEALYYHNLIDREPFEHSITIYTGYGVSRLTEDNVKVYTVKKELLDLGKTYVKSNMGNLIPMYDMERTICDLVRNRSGFEMQEYTTALKSYVKRKDKDLNKLMKYAKCFRVDKLIRSYLEVLL